MGRRDAGRRLKPFAGLAQQVTQRPHGRDGDGAGAPGQDQDVVVPPAHVLQRVVLLFVCVQEKWGGRGGGGRREREESKEEEEWVKEETLSSAVFFYLMIYWLVMGRMAVLPMTQRQQLAQCCTTWLWSPAQHLSHNTWFIVGAITMIKTNAVEEMIKQAIETTEMRKCTVKIIWGTCANGVWNYHYEKENLCRAALILKCHPTIKIFFCPVSVLLF